MSLNALSNWLILSSLALLLIGCGGGGNDSGSLTGDEPVSNSRSIRIELQDAEIPVNTRNIGGSRFEPTTTEATIFVTDNEGRPAPPGTTVNVTVSPQSLAFINELTPDEDEDGDGIIDTAFSTKDIEVGGGGVATIFVTSTPVAGTVTLYATLAEPDINTGDPIFASAEIEIVPVTSELGSLRFSGPFVQAVIEGQSAFGAGLVDGTYSRVVSVIASDRNGNPVPFFTDIDFFVIDDPVVGFPEQGPGSFFIAGPDGNPAENGFGFTAPSGQFISRGVLPGDRLVLDGTMDILPNNRLLTGIRAIDRVLSETSLTIRATEFPFTANQGLDNGSTVPYVIGRAQNAAILSPQTVGALGVADTLLTYPTSLVGRTAILVACTQDREICTVLNTCDANGANCNAVFLPDIGEEDDVQITVSRETLGPNTSASVVVCLRDNNLNPIAARTITYDISTENLGAAAVSVNGSAGISGTLRTGGDGCATANISASGQVPGGGEIAITFDSANVVEPATVTINPVTTATLSIIAESCDLDEYLAFNRFGSQNQPTSVECTITLRLTEDATGLPLSDIEVTAAPTFEPVDGGIAIEPPLLSIDFFPDTNGGLQGITNSNGVVVVEAELRVGGNTTILFSAAGSEATFDLNLPLVQFQTEIRLTSETNQSFGDRAGTGITVFELQVVQLNANDAVLLPLPGVAVTHRIEEDSFIDIVDVDYVPSGGVDLGITDESGIVTVTVFYEFGVPDDENTATYSITFVAQGGSDLTRDISLSITPLEDEN